MQKYLLGVHLSKKEYRKYREDWEHDHCEFCSVKFSETEPGSLREGYATEDNYRWICEPCFNDFKNKFNWQIDETIGR
ncbi:MAG: hypothetical protein O7D86_10770 [Proteobacteria bacterium]|nr:hypothetical protein [Pseudomonadota bacterium]